MPRGSLNLRFGEQSSTGTLDEALPQSIYLAIGIVGGKNGWFHQILRGDLHEWNFEDRRASIGFLLTTLLFKSPSMTHLRERFCP
jgi:hypothetical protein